MGPLLIVDNDNNDDGNDYDVEGDVEGDVYQGKPLERPQWD